MYGEPQKISQRICGHQTRFSLPFSLSLSDGSGGVCGGGGGVKGESPFCEKENPLDGVRSYSASGSPLSRRYARRRRENGGLVTPRSLRRSTVTTAPPLRGTFFVHAGIRVTHRSANVLTVGGVKVGLVGGGGGGGFGWLLLTKEHNRRDGSQQGHG